MIEECELSDGAQIPSSSPFGVFSTTWEVYPTVAASPETPVTAPEARGPSDGDDLDYDCTAVNDLALTEIPESAYYQQGTDNVQQCWTDGRLPEFSLKIQPGYEFPSLCASLIDAYASRVAPTLIPVHDSLNPWLRYPTIALQLSMQEGKSYLLHALMAQAAFALGRNGQDSDRLSRLGFNFHSLAVAEFRSSIQQGTVGCLDVLTTILTLFLIEVR